LVCEINVAVCLKIFIRAGVSEAAARFRGGRPLPYGRGSDRSDPFLVHGLNDAVHWLRSEHAIYPVAR